ncbi:MAG: NAD-dependent epimerase/dehydratase family protein [Anaerolineales bacterium]|nr:NAD-dependent epimerase/dehydratase family protein [Anaerolineales bacterium]
MRILVTGGAGFIGSHTVDLLLSRGHTVRVLDALEPPVHAERRRPDYLPAEAEFILGDVRDRAAWERALAGVDAVFHLAAYQDYLPDFSKFFHVNVVSTALLYEVVVERRLPVQKIVVAASQAVYGEGKYRRADGSAVYPGQRPAEQLARHAWDLLDPETGAVLTPDVTDEAVVHPHNSYAMSKYTEEQIALNLGRRYGLPSVAMRYSIVQGARQSFRNAYSGALRIFAMQCLAGERPLIYEDGQQLRDYVYVGDVARANLLVLEDPRADYQAFNVGAGRAWTVLEFARIMAEAAGRPDLEPRLPGEYRFGDTRHITSDTRRLQALGWEPRGHPAQSAREYLDWAVRQPDFGNYTAAAREHMKQVGAVKA